MALRLDMSKIYDRVEWSFLWFKMWKLGLDSRWINWIKECVSIVSYFNIVEGQSLDILSQIEVSDKGILYPYIFSSYVQKDYPSCFTK